MATPNKSVNAWIYLKEDEPAGTSYSTPGSSYQSLKAYGVYNSIDLLSICWARTVPTSPSTTPPGDGSTYTIELEPSIHPDGSSNLDYMTWMIRDARAMNPRIKILIMMGYAADAFTQIFSSDPTKWQQNADDYASNLLAYLQQYDLDGFDVDWEPDLSDNGTPEQFRLLFTAIRAAFASQDRYYYLTFSPNEIGTLDVPTLNSAFDLVSLQLYGGADAQMFIQAGVSPSLLACGIKFEPSGGVIYEDAQQAYSLYLAESYNGITIWRLSSTDFQYEQAQQMLLYQLVYGLPFDDTLIIGAAGNPPISQLAIRSGDVLDAIQVTNSGTFGNNSLQYVLQKHGGDGGDASTLTIADGDAVVEVSGYTGIWSDVSCVAQLTITTLQGEVFGPFGSTEHASALTPFQFKAPEGEAIAAFRGAIVQAEVTGGSKTYVVGNLSASYASLTTP